MNAVMTYKEMYTTVSCQEMYTAVMSCEEMYNAELSCQELYAFECLDYYHVSV